MTELAKRHSSDMSELAKRPLEHDAETVSSSQDERLQNPSILLLGADSKNGLEVLRRLASHPRKPSIHAFVEDFSKLREEDLQLCTSVIEGSVRHAIDIQEALEETSANWVVLAAGDDDAANIEDRRRNRNIRTSTAKNTATVLDMPHLRYVRAVVISRICAAPQSSSSSSGIKMGLRERLCRRASNCELHDYVGLEEALHSIRDRVTFVRTTRVKDFRPSSTTTSNRRLLLTVNHNDKTTSPYTSRSDLASFVVDEILDQPRIYGNRVVNVTSVSRG